MAETNVVNCLAAVNLTIGVSRNIDNACVNSEHFGELNRRGFFNVASGEEKVISVGSRKIGFALRVCNNSR